jgi:hypothetical protein
MGTGQNLTVMSSARAAEATALQPVLRIAAAALPVFFPLLLVLISVGAWQGLGRASGVPGIERVGSWAEITGGLAVWLVAVSLLAMAGLYKKAPMAIPFGVPVLSAFGLFLFTRVPAASQLLQAAPVSWLIGTMVVRVAGGSFLVALAKGELASRWFALWAGGFDLFVGVTALPLAWWVGTGSQTALWAAVVWNVIGLLDFVVAIAIGRVVPGSGLAQMLLLETPVMRALKPTVYGIGTFGVPLAIIVHVSSLWQLANRL